MPTDVCDHGVEAIGWKVDAYGQKKFKYQNQVITTKLPGSGNDTRWLECGDGLSDARYGINNRVAVFQQGDSHKILMVEYDTLVADVVGADASSFLWPDKAAPRHRGLMNVLHGDGNVTALSPATIDPLVLEYHNQYWKPFRDPKLAP